MFLDRILKDTLQSELENIRTDPHDGWLEDTFGFLGTQYAEMYDEILRYMRHEKINVDYAHGREAPLLPVILIESGSASSMVDQSIGLSRESVVVRSDIALIKFSLDVTISGLKLSVITRNEDLTFYLWLVTQYLILGNTIGIARCFGDTGFHNVSVSGQAATYNASWDNGASGIGRDIMVTANFISQVGSRRRSYPLSGVRTTMQTHTEARSDPFYDDVRYI